MLKSKTVVGSRSGPHLLITAGVHGDEYEPMAAVRSVLHRLAQNAGKTLCGSVTLIPLVNEPAFQRASRVGEDHLDLARVCPGNPQGSTTERIAAAVADLIKTADYYMDLHGGGNRYKLSGLAGYTLHPSKDILEKQRAMARAFNLPIVWGTDASLQGRTLSVARDAGVPGIYTEFGGGGSYEEHITDAYVAGCLNVMKYLKMIPGEVAKEQTLYHLEDERDHSGFLQKMLPSPGDGFFLPKVRLGQMIEHQEIMGYIQDPLGDEEIPVLADQAGMVFMLRALPPVRKGESLGGILPVNAKEKYLKIYA